MAYRVLKETTGSGRLVMLWRLYNFLNDPSETQWSVIFTNGNFATADGAGLVDGDYFVVRCATAWGDGKYMEIAFSAATLVSAFGGLSDTDYPLSARSVGIVFSPDGGWDAGTKAFAPAGGLPVVYKNRVEGSTPFNFKMTVSSHMEHLQMFAGVVTGAPSTTVDMGFYIGAITSIDTTGDDKACVLIIGKPLCSDVSGNWGDLGGGWVAVPNSAWTAWEGAYCEFSLTFWGLGRTKNGDKYIEFPCYIFTDGGKVAGELIQVKKIDAALANYSVSGDGTRVAANGLTFAWSV